MTSLVCASPVACLWHEWARGCGVGRGAGPGGAVRGDRCPCRSSPSTFGCSLRPHSALTPFRLLYTHSDRTNLLLHCVSTITVAAVRREVGKWLLVQQRDDLGAGKPTAPESGARAQCTQHRATQSRLDREDADAVQLLRGAPRPAKMARAYIVLPKIDVAGGKTFGE